jgi:hypothetical protein
MNGERKKDNIKKMVDLCAGYLNLSMLFSELVYCFNSDHYERNVYRHI